jgi:energy-coupling factor transporter ATP-binding protein EcfA2
MSNPSERLKQTLLRVAAVFQAVAVLWLAIATGHTSLAKAMHKLAFPNDVGNFLGWGIPILTAVTLFVMLWRASLVRSRIVDPDRFELRPRNRSDLKGREQDIRDLLALIADSPLLFLIGESGSGKSTLLETGLLPDIKEQTRFVPILMRRYGSSWDSGPLKELLAALQIAASKSDSSPTDQPKVDANFEALRTALRQLAQRTARQPLLIFDQFDDYILAHRRSFTTKRGSWKDERAVRRDNLFWGVISELLESESIRCIFATRSDASSGLECVRFLPPTDIASRDVLRLKPEYLSPLLNELAPAEAQPPIISNPERGWSQLKSVLDNELQRNGAVLPQQVRTVALGLRALKWLTIREYRQNGSATGMEALYVGRAIADCAQRVQVHSRLVRALLGKLVVVADSEADIKTIALTRESLSDVFAHEDQLNAVLQELVQVEIVRRVWNAEKAAEEWQLDHDYLAGAVRLEARSSGRSVAMLREYAARWRSATDLRMRWGALLPLRLQTSFVRERLGAENAFRYGSDAGFALLSLARLLPAAAALIAGASLWWWTHLDLRIQTLIEADRGPMSLWDAGPFIRARVANELMENRRKRLYVEETWPLPILGLDRESIHEVVTRTLESKQFDSSDFDLLNEVVPLLDRTTVDRTSKVLLARWTVQPLRSDDERLVDVLGALHSATSQEQSRVVATTALSKLTRLMQTLPTEPNKLMSGESNRCARIAPILTRSDSRTIGLAVAAIEPHIKDESSIIFATGCVRLYGELLQSLEARSDARLKSTDVLASYVIDLAKDAYQPEVNRNYFIPALMALAEADKDRADAVASRIYNSSLEQFRSHCFTHEKACADSKSSVKFDDLTGRAFDFSVAFNSKTASAILHDLVADYWNMSTRDVVDRNDASGILHAIQRLAAQLDDAGAEELLHTLRSNSQGAESTSLLQSDTLVMSVVRNTSSNDFFETLGILAPHLRQSSADRVISDLDGIPMDDSQEPLEYQYLDMLGNMAPYMSSSAALDLAHKLEASLKISKAPMFRAHQLRALGHIVYVLPPAEISTISKTFIENLFGPDGTDRDSASATTEAAGRACEAMVRSGLKRGAGIECMLLAVAAPKPPVYILEPDTYSWKEIAKFAGLPATALPSDILAWAEKKESISLTAIRPSTVRAHLNSTN